MASLPVLEGVRRGSKPALRVVDIVALLLLGLVSATAAPDPRLANPIAPGSVFVKYNAASDDGVVSASASSADSLYVASRVVPLSTGGSAGTLPLRPGETTDQAVERYQQVPGVEFATRNLWVHAMDFTGDSLVDDGALGDGGDDGTDDDGSPTGSGYYDASGFPFSAPVYEPLWVQSWSMVKVGAAYVWGRGIAGRSQEVGEETRVCIIDSGIDLTHPELQSSVVDGAAFLDGKPPAYGKQYVQDEYGHGTRMAGLIAAARNGRGMAGLLNKGAALYICKFMDKDGFGTVANAYQCLDWCIKKQVPLSVAAWGANIGSMSWENPGDDGYLFYELQKLLQAHGHSHLMVTAAGNHGRQLLPRESCPAFFFVPAQLRTDNMLVVAASNEQDKRWRVDTSVTSDRTLAGIISGTIDPCALPLGLETPAGSNYGSAWVDIAAPGNYMWTTTLRTPENSYVAYQQVRGTSVATALVSGAVGLIMSATANQACENMLEVKQAILAGADVIPALQPLLPDGQQVVGGGRRLNAYNAFAAYLGDAEQWRWLPKELCGIDPSVKPPPPASVVNTTSQPPPPLRKPPSPPPPVKLPATNQHPPQSPRPPPSPKSLKPPPHPSPRPPKPPPSLRPTKPPLFSRPPRPSPPPPKPRAQQTQQKCKDGFVWVAASRKCVTCAKRYPRVSYCAKCNAKKCTLRCPPNQQKKFPCSLYRALLRQKQSN